MPTNNSQQVGAIEKSRSTAFTRRRMLAGLGVSGATGIAGCTGILGDDDDDASITVLSSESDPATQEIFDALAEEYEEREGVEVTFDYVSFEDFPQRLATMIRGGNPPEIAIFSVALMGDLHRDDMLEPVTDIVDGRGMAEATRLITDGEDWSIPIAVKMHMQTARGDLIEQAGFELPDDPTAVTQDQMLDWAEGVDGAFDTRGIGIANGQTTKGTHEAVTYLWMNGVDIWSGEPGNIDVSMDRGENRQKSIEAMEYVRELNEFAPTGADWSWGELSEAISTGTVANTMYSFGRTGAAVRDANPQWYDDLYVFESPWNQMNSNELTNVGFVSSFGVLKDAANVEAAKEFIRDFLDDDRYIEWLHSVPFHYTPSAADVFESDEYRSHPDIADRPDVLELQEALLPRTSSFLFSADNRQLNLAAGQAYNLGTLGGILERVNIQEMDIEDAIDETAADLREEL